MDHFRYEDGQLVCDGVGVGEVAERHGTPLYVYSEAALRENVRSLRGAFAEAEPVICYAMKANDSLAVCKTLLGQGVGFDIVSGGELFRALHIGADPRKMVYAGVGKSVAEIEAALRAELLLLNVESEPELERIRAIAARLGLTADLGLRINPDVDVKAHRHTTTGKKGTKFGLNPDDAARVVERVKSMSEVRLIGLHMHLGSPINKPEPYGRALKVMVPFVEFCRGLGVDIRWLDVGGGYGTDYKGGEAAAAGDYAAAIVPHVRRAGCRLILEPGRYLVGNAAVLVTRVEYVKQGGGKTFVICDAGMNDLIRPALYDAYHRVWPVRSAEPVPYGADALEARTDGRVVMDVVGPVCETGDYLARGRAIPPVREGDLLAVFSAGAYGYSMSSNYNSRPRACEVMVASGGARVIRERETYETMTAQERF